MVKATGQGFQWFAVKLRVCRFFCGPVVVEMFAGLQRVVWGLESCLVWSFRLRYGIWGYRVSARVSMRFSFLSWLRVWGIGFAMRVHLEPHPWWKSRTPTRNPKSASCKPESRKLRPSGEEAELALRFRLGPEILTVAKARGLESRDH